jgi:carboxyl-terminal processing protease
MKYKTLINNRVVYGGGGIMPDLFIPIDTTRFTDYHRRLVATGLINRVAMNYLDQNRKEVISNYRTFENYKKSFKVTDNILQSLLDMAAEEKIEFNEEQYTHSKPLIELQIKALIARDMYEMAEYFRIMNDDNPGYLEALRIINDKEAYEKELGRNN